MEPGTGSGTANPDRVPASVPVTGYLGSALEPCMMTTGRGPDGEWRDNPDGQIRTIGEAVDHTSAELTPTEAAMPRLNTSGASCRRGVSAARGLLKHFSRVAVADETKKCTGSQCNKTIEDRVRCHPDQ